MKEVVSNFIKQKNKLGEAITPIYLYSIQYDAQSNSWLRFVGMAEDVIFDGETYFKQAVKHTAIKEDSSGVVSALKLEIQNVDKIMQSYLDTYNGLKGKKVLITLVFKEAINDPECFVEYEYFVDSSTSSERIAYLNLACAIDVLNASLPRRIFSPSRCQYAEFKDVDCGYSGVENTCDRSYINCLALGNSQRFGGFPGVPMTFGKLL